MVIVGTEAVAAVARLDSKANHMDNPIHKVLVRIHMHILSLLLVLAFDPMNLARKRGCSLQHRLYVTNLLLLSVSQLLDLGLDPQVEFIDLSELFQEQVFLRWVHSLVFIRY